MSYTVQVGYSDGTYFVLASDIPGLNIEAQTFEEFVAITRDVAPDLVGPHEEGSRISFQQEVEFAA